MFRARPPGHPGRQRKWWQSLELQPALIAFCLILDKIEFFEKISQFQNGPSTDHWCLWVQMVTKFTINPWPES
jgi:hypothetical protein